MTLTIIRANNPCAIRPLRGARWNGQDGTVISGRSGEFARFSEMRWGLRAGLRNLDTYIDRHGLNTVRKVIDRWAPPIENNTDAYVIAVANALGVRPDAPLPRDYATMRRLLCAIIDHETGGFVPAEADIAAAFRIMAVEEARRPGGDPAPYRSGRVGDAVRRVPREKPTETGAAGGAAGVGFIGTISFYWTELCRLASEIGGGLPDIPREEVLRIAVFAVAAILILWAVQRVLSKKRDNEDEDSSYEPGGDAPPPDPRNGPDDAGGRGDGGPDAGRASDPRPAGWRAAGDHAPSGAGWRPDWG